MNRRVMVGVSLWMAASIPLVPAATWTGTVGNDWFDPGNWDPVAVPGANVAVSVPVGAAILLTNETAALASFTMAGGTLTFSNWFTRLRSDAVEINGGTLTLPPAFTEAQMSNRVWIVCSNLTLASSASINVNGLGYATANGAGTGGGNSGGGHGGFGSCGNPGTGDPWSARGHPYGNAAEPLAPGSGGCGTSRGGNGGGAVCIQAAGDVTITGTITANGQSGRSGGTIHKGGGAGGSGGSIFIACATLQGDGTGLLSVSGGSSSCPCHANGGMGGGGRIAVVYRSAAQALLSGPTPPVKMAAAPGAFGRGPDLGERGTVYLPDGRFLTSEMSAAHWQQVTLIIPDFDEWHTSSLTIAGSFGLKDLACLRVDGDLTLAAGGSLTVSGVATNAVSSGAGTALMVGRMLTIEKDASLVLESHWANGTWPDLKCGSLNVHADGSVETRDRHGPARGAGQGGTR